MNGASNMTDGHGNNRKSLLEHTWQQLHSHLAGQAGSGGDNTPLYAMADGAAHPHIHAHLEAYQHPCLCLFGHPQVPPEQSPWLFPLQPNDTFSDWYLQESAGRYWGVLLASQLPLAALGSHLQGFLTAQDESGGLHLLRLFDPRGCRAVLQVLEATQLQAFFQPLPTLWLDQAGDPAHWQQVQYRDGKLHTRTLARPQPASGGPNGEACAC